MQQYQYKKKFPFNDTIKETNRENLSDGKSNMTFTSIRHRKNFQFQKDEKLGPDIQHALEGNADHFYDMKSETMIRNYETDNSPSRRRYEGVAFLQRNSAFAGGQGMSERVISMGGSQSVCFQILGLGLEYFLLIMLVSVIYYLWSY